ncbi:MAG: hypothetical protein JRF63_02465 [Deltaproteobacteria bacterium]|nr:hypothetical protein [Deltaproteobacteria bacterium]
MKARVAFRIVSILAFLIPLGLAFACGDDDEAPPVVPGVEGQPAQPATVAQPANQPTPTPAAKTGATNIDPEKECRVDEYCERKCKGECALEERDRGPYFKAKQAKIGGAPFDVTVKRVYLEGACHKGDTPEKRKSTNGVRAIVEGELTYTGNDILYRAGLKGEMYARYGADRYAEVGVMEKTYSRGWYGGTKLVTRFTREVRGSDPWLTGQSRPFHWESNALSEAFCEANPDEAQVYIELWTYGVREGRAEYPVKFVPLNWDEISGMALRQQVKVEVKKKKEVLEEPADAHYSQLGKILVTRLTGKTEWLKRSSVVQNGMLTRGPAAAFPVEGSSEEWKVRVTGITQAKEFGGYAHKGEDQFLAIVEVQLEYTGEEEGSLKGLSVRLETSPGKWQKTVSKAVGQLDTGGTVQSGGSTSGKMVFPKQRFERPFRVEIKTPDKETVYLDVLSYSLGPERGAK